MLLQNLKLQRPPLLLCALAGTALLLSAAHMALANNTQAFAKPVHHTVYTPVILPKPADKAKKPPRNPFAAPIAPKASRHAPAPTPTLKGIVHNGSTRIAIIEFKGQSGYYQAGTKLADYTVSNIDNNSVKLTSGTQTLTLKCGGTDNA